MQYNNLSKEELLKLIKKQESDLKSKKYGLVWDDEKEPEQVVLDCRDNLPILRRIKGKKIKEPKDNTGEDNILIEGDNYHALTVLNYTHQEKIDVIYIDPPYNTGQKDFIYNDSFVDKEDGYRHSKWLNFMEKRLNLAKSLLTKDGIIFISIDDNEVFNLKLLCDKIFGEENYLGNVIRNTNSTKNQSNYLSITYDYTLVYTKNETCLNEVIKEKKQKWEVEKNNLDEYIKQIKRLKKKGLLNDDITLELKELTKYPRFIDFVNYWYIDDKFEKFGVYRKDNLGGVKNGNKTAILNPLTNKLDPIPPGGFRYSDKKLKELTEEGRIHFHTDGSLPTIKRYLFENKKSRPKGIMSDDQRPDYTLLKNMGLQFDNPKQLAFLERVFSIFKKDIIVLDFFAGSASTAHALMNLNKKDDGNRKFILCTNNENNICTEVTYPRIQKVIKGYKNVKNEDTEGLGGNLQYFKTSLIQATKNRDQTKIDLTKKCTEMLCVKENIFNFEIGKDDFKIFSSNKKDKFLCVYYNFIEESFEEFLKEIKKFKGEKIIYMFSLEDKIDKPLFKEIENCKLEAIPEKILEIYKKLVKMNIPIKAETIFVDLEKAKKQIFEDKDKDTGAKTLRVVLEKLVQKIAQKNQINILTDKGKEIKISTLNDILKNENIFTQLDWEENKICLTIGNYASHGEYNEFDLTQVNKFYKHIQTLINKFNI